LGTWEGEIEGKPAIWLRLFDSEGNLILLPEEAAEQARQQEVQARQQAEQAQRDAIPRLLAMGLTIEQVAEALGLSVDEINRNVR
jgi:predicted transposase/invertase (TIGR01784 family)